MDDLNDLLFIANRCLQRCERALTVCVAEFVAQWLVFGAAVLVIALWVWGASRKRYALLAAGVATLIALGINQVIGQLWFHPRPFMIGLGRTLMPHASETSFPSDHATFLWSLGFGLIITGAWRWWGWPIAASGLVVAWSRVYLGLHFPFDMAGSLIVSLAAAALARALQPSLRRWLLPSTESVYEFLLERLSLPTVLFPRRHR